MFGNSNFSHCGGYRVSKRSPSGTLTDTLASQATLAASNLHIVKDHFDFDKSVGRVLFEGKLKSYSTAVRPSVSLGTVSNVDRSNKTCESISIHLGSYHGGSKPEPPLIQTRHLT